VTKFTLRTHKQTEVWGGLVVVPLNYTSAISNATIRFANETTDPKAAIVVNAMLINNATMYALQMFYDAPTVPAGIFDDFLAVPSIKSDVSTRSFLSLIQAFNATKSLAGNRGFGGVAEVQYLSPLLFEVMTGSIELWQIYAEASSMIEYDITFEPFLPNMLTHGGPSAYPDSRAESFLPVGVNILWTDPAQDCNMRNLVEETVSYLWGIAVGQGQYDTFTAMSYPNYATADNQLQYIYGKNSPRLIALREQYDPEGVMLLTGGWKFLQGH